MYINFIVKMYICTIMLLDHIQSTIYIGRGSETKARWVYRYIVQEA